MPMFPVLFTVGKFSISAFGVFLAIGIILGLFLIWRLSRAWDLDEEKTLDLTILTFVGGVLGARIYFVILNFPFFSENLFKIFLITKYSGFSFWGAFLGGILTIYYFTKRWKWDFLQMADIASIGFLGGLIFSEIGCFFGGCGVGTVTKSFFGVSMVGLIGKRWPIQLMEALIYSILLYKLWFKATHFHQKGRIISLALIWIGVVKIILQPIRQSQDIFFAGMLIILGFAVLYKTSKGRILIDIKEFFIFLGSLFVNPKSRKVVLAQVRKNWYNFWVHIGWKARNIKKTLRRFNVRFSFKSPGKN